MTTEWKPKPPKSLARSMTYCSSPPGLTPTGTIAHFVVAATTAVGPQPVDVQVARIVDTRVLAVIRRAWLSVSDNLPALIGDQRASARAYRLGGALGAACPRRHRTCRDA